MRPLALLVLLAAAMLLPGCLERTISITSTPPGARVWVNDVEVGTTPVEMDFTYYGSFDVRLRRDGYEPLSMKQKVEPPLAERPVIDLFAEAIPTKFENRVAWHFDLAPLAERSDQRAAEAEMIVRGKELREKLPPSPLPPNQVGPARP